MAYYVGTDLGTTNSAICSHDGANIRLYKSPNQEDLTPSAIFIDRRGNKYVGRLVYDNAPRTPDSAAILFKRIMGTSTSVKLSAVNLTVTQRNVPPRSSASFSATYRKKCGTRRTSAPSSRCRPRSTPPKTRGASLSLKPRTHWLPSHLLFCSCFADRSPIAGGGGALRRRRRIKR